MEQEKIGKFIATLRKEKGLTQQELAEKLGITKNAVSKWERGLGLMDMSLLKPLSEILDVSVTEILNGERFSTYVIEGEKNSGTICLNGAAARKVQKGDKIIIVAYAIMDEKEQQSFSPKIVHVDDENKIV